DAEDEVQQVANRPRLAAILRERGAEQQGEIHAGQPQLARDADHGREHQRAEQAAAERRAHHRDASPTATAASMSARCTSACGKLPRNAPDAGSISSEYSPTSLACPSSRSMSVDASSSRPARARALTSQNEQFRKEPSAPGRPSSAR